MRIHLSSALSAVHERKDEEKEKKTKQKKHNKRVLVPVSGFKFFSLGCSAPFFQVKQITSFPLPLPLLLSLSPSFSISLSVCVCDVGYHQGGGGSGGEGFGENALPLHHRHLPPRRHDLLLLSFLPLFRDAWEFAFTFFLQFSRQTDEGESVRADAPGTGCCVNPFGGRLTECSRSSRGGSRRMRWSEPFSVPFIFKAHNICVREGVFPQCDGGVKEMEVAEWMGGAGGGRG